MIVFLGFKLKRKEGRRGIHMGRRGDGRGGKAVQGMSLPDAKQKMVWFCHKAVLDSDIKIASVWKMMGNKQHLLFLNGHSLVETMRTLRWNASGSFQAPESILIGNALKNTSHWPYMVQTKIFLYPMSKWFWQLCFLTEMAMYPMSS